MKSRIVLDGVKLESRHGEHHELLHNPYLFYHTVWIDLQIDTMIQRIKQTLVA